MKRNLIVLLTILVCGLTACKPGQKKDGNMEKETKLKIETSAGDIIVKLYNETPKHRDNFIKLAEEGTYEGTLFHRVIKDFMIQAGDPESKNAPKGKMLGAFFFQAEDGIRDFCLSRGLGDVYKRQYLYLSIFYFCAGGRKIFPFLFGSPENSLYLSCKSFDICLLYTSDGCRRIERCRSRWSSNKLKKKKKKL